MFLLLVVGCVCLWCVHNLRLAPQVVLGLGDYATCDSNGFFVAIFGGCGAVLQAVCAAIATSRAMSLRFPPKEYAKSGPPSDAISRGLNATQVATIERNTKSKPNLAMQNSLACIAVPFQPHTDFMKREGPSQQLFLCHFGFRKYHPARSVSAWIKDQS